jgi:hypothetical protein
VTDTRNIAVISHAAAPQVEGVDRLETLYYPYVHFAVSCRMPRWFAARDIQTRCLVDGRRGSAATADAFQLEATEAASSEILDTKIDSKLPEKAALRYVSHALRRGAKAIAHFALRLDHRGLVYKKFWLATIGNQRFIIDSVTGASHRLRSVA